MIVYCVLCRRLYLVIRYSTLYLSSQWQYNNWIIFVTHRLWTLSGLDPFPVPGAESLTPDLAKDYLPASQISPTRD